jgi:cytochrome c oxidase subunit 1
MTTETMRATTGRSPTGEAAAFAYIAAAGLVLLLMMLIGLVMRMAQAQWVTVDSELFYVLMTMHGAGMVGVAGLGGAAIMWYFVRQYVPVSTGIFLANLALFVTGALFVLGAGFIGGFAAGWTFLFPLPASSGFQWPPAAAAAYFIGLLLIGVGFLLFYLDIARGVISVYRGLGNALGVKQALGLAPPADGPPAAVTASTMVLIVNIVGIVCGAVVLALSLVNLYIPAFALNPLVIKNMIYFFGHVFINATIYMAVIAIYEILPIYAHRPWRTSRVFYLGWIASTVMVLTAYPHHLLMDFVMPSWVLIAGQIISWCSGLPVALITAFGTLTIVYRSGIRWDTASGLLFAGMLGWIAGGIPAIVDSTIPINSLMHNTLWVPGHFHTYLLGMMAMLLGFATYITHGRSPAGLGFGPLGFWLYLLGSAVFVLAFLAGGSAGVPRRYAVHLSEWLPYDRMGVLGAIMIVAGALLLIVRTLNRFRGLAQDGLDNAR